MGDSGGGPSPKYDSMEVEDSRMVQKDGRGPMVQEKFQRRINFDTVGRKKEWESFYATPEGKKAITKRVVDYGGWYDRRNISGGLTSGVTSNFLKDSAKILPNDSAWKWGGGKEKQELKDLEIARALAPTLAKNKATPAKPQGPTNNKQFAGRSQVEGTLLGSSGSAFRTLLGE